MKKLKIIIPSLVFLLFICLLWIKPRKVKSECPGNFAQLNAALKTYRPGASAAVIDMDKLDHNVYLVTHRLGNDFKLRIVAKSLPSLDLLQYLMEKAKTNRLMVFSEPYISELLARFNPDSLDMLLGKPLPVEALARLSAHPGWLTVNWLVDTKERLNEYLAYAKKENAKLKISLEIDVGLHRGGLETPAELGEAAELIKANGQYLELTGLMGYDGHVTYVPFYINKQRAINKAFVKVQESYTQFVDELKKHYDAKYISSLTFNGGGSKTYFYYPEYKNITPVNDVALGSGFLTPAEYPEDEAVGHQPALFLASLVLKKIETAKLPNAEKLTRLVYWWNPNIKVTYFMLDGGFAGEPMAPTGIRKNEFWELPDKGVTNLLPNQSVLSSSDENNLHAGDYVFYHPWEGDGMLQFKKVILVRQNKVVGEWETYKGAN